MGVRRQWIGVATMLGSGLSAQLGAAVGSLAFPVLGPAGVVAVRQFIAPIVLVPLARPRPWTYTWRQWWPVLLLAAVFAGMNLGLYAAIDRLGLGLAATLEFLGPLGVALASSRTRLNAACALAAGVGVVVLMAPGPSTDWTGISLGLLAAAGWACYILLNRVVGRRVAGLEGTATAASVSALAYVPVAVLVFRSHPVTAAALGCAFVAGVLASAVPYMADLITLRRVPQSLFGIFMSVQPVYGALVGVVVLGQALATHEWVGMGAIVVSNVVAVTAAGRGAARAPRTRVASPTLET